MLLGTLQKFKDDSSQKTEKVFDNLIGDSTSLSPLICKFYTVMFDTCS